MLQGLARKSWLGVLVAGAALVVGASMPMAGAARVGPDDAKKVAKVGEKAPDFKVKDTEGKEHTLSQYTKEGKIVVLEWFNSGCPFVVKHHQNHKTMKETYERYKDNGVVWLAVNSGAPGKQGHGLELNREFKKKWEITYPILMDESGTVGRAYDAKTTPHMYIIDKDGILRYAGAIDNDNSAARLGSINYVDKALREILAGETVEFAETKPYGCSVKYGSPSQGG